MSRFRKHPHVVYDHKGNPRRPWLLVTPCVYVTEVAGHPEAINIPAGYRTDGASVPRIPFVHSRYGNRAFLPAIVHDYLYEKDTRGMTRKQCDLVFLEAMVDEGDPPRPATRWAMYLGVRLGGGGSWCRYRRGA